MTSKLALAIFDCQFTAACPWQDLPFPRCRVQTVISDFLRFPHHRTRRRPLLRRAINTFILTVILLLFIVYLYSCLSFFSSHPSQPHSLPHDSIPSFDPLLDDLPDIFGKSISNDDRIDVLDDTALDSDNNNEEVVLEEEEEDGAQNHYPATKSSYFFDPISGGVRRSLNRRSFEEWEDYVPFSSKMASDLGFMNDGSKLLFASDDTLVDEKLRKKLSEVKKIDDALMMKGSKLRQGWAKWFDKKADFMRRDHMFRSSIETLNPLNNPILQDPDGPGLTGFTRGDKMYLKGIMNDFKRAAFLSMKPLEKSASQIRLPGKKSSPGGKEVRMVERRTLDNDQMRIAKSNEGSENAYYADGTRWGYYPGLDRRLSFENFMDAFFRRGRCHMRVFMVWNSPDWAFSVRQQRGLESFLYHHSDACMVVFSETMELNFFKEFVKDGYKVAVVMPNLDELLKDTPTHIFASVWHKWKETKHYPTHYSELIRLAVIYKYGGTYLDSDVIVLKPLSTLNNSIGYEDELDGETLNGAVMSFRKHRYFRILSTFENFPPFILDLIQVMWNPTVAPMSGLQGCYEMGRDIFSTQELVLRDLINIWLLSSQSFHTVECLSEFYASYDDTLLRWNGADLVTRATKTFTGNKSISDMKVELKIQPSLVFFPIRRHTISRYFAEPKIGPEQLDQDTIFNKILNQSFTFHFWNSLTAALIPEPGSLVFRLLNQYCIYCSDAL